MSISALPVPAFVGRLQRSGQVCALLARWAEHDGDTAQAAEYRALAKTLLDRHYGSRPALCAAIWASLTARVSP